MAKAKKLRIRLLSYDHRLLDESAKKIVETAKRTGSPDKLRIKFSCEIRLAVLQSIQKHIDINLYRLQRVISWRKKKFPNPY